MNANPEDGAVYGETPFSDLTPEAFYRRLLAFRYRVPPAMDANTTYTVEDTFDWRTYNAVTPVKDQGMSRLPG